MTSGLFSPGLKRRYAADTAGVSAARFSASYSATKHRGPTASHRETRAQRSFAATERAACHFSCAVSSAARAASSAADFLPPQFAALPQQVAVSR